MTKTRLLKELLCGQGTTEAALKQHIEKKAKKEQASESLGQSCFPYQRKFRQMHARCCQQISRGVREVFGSK